MPHQVLATLFRPHSSSFDLPHPGRSRSERGSSGNLGQRPFFGHRSSSNSKPVFDENDANMPVQDHKELRDFKRISLNKSPRSSAKVVPQVGKLLPAQLAIDIESPPLVFYGQTTNSTGALLSGQLHMDVSEEELMVDAIEMKLVISVKMKKPFHAHCPECAHQPTDLTTWTFHQGGKKAFHKGRHDFPFSFLLPGHLPATMHGSLSVIDYVLKVVVTPAAVTNPASTVGAKSVVTPIYLQRELPVKRAIPPQELPKQSIRIFPPTHLTAHVELPSVIYPIGEYNCTFRLDGVMKRNTIAGTQTTWRLKRLTWRMEETQTVIAPACPKHAAKAGAVGDEKKGISHTDVRVLGTGELKSGWKADYSGTDGSVDMEFAFNLRPELNPLYDVKAEDGTEVSHALVVEMIVAEEFAPIKKPAQSTPTGAARVLRMHFNTTVTERTGMGISWDEEQPPLYDDVPASPPRYGNADVYEGAPIPDYQELDMMRDHNGGPSSSANASP